MGGPSGSDYKKQTQVQQQQLDIATQQQTQSTADKAQMTKLLQPAINFETAVTTDPNALNTAAAPQIGQLAQAGKATEEQIYESIPAGPARDLAIAQNKMGTNSSIAGTKNSLYTGALDKLANIGSGLGSFSLQELGAALTGLQSSSATGQGVIANKANTKAATTGMIGDFVGAAGAAAGGGAFGHL